MGVGGKCWRRSSTCSVRSASMSHILHEAHSELHCEATAKPATCMGSGRAVPRAKLPGASFMMEGNMVCVFCAVALECMATVSDRMPR